MSWLPWTLLALLWVGSGVVAVAFLLHRRGHRDGTWYLLGAVLGPLFIPIASERAGMKSVVVEQHGASPEPGPGGSGSLRLLVGVDGSQESEQAVRDAGRLAEVVAGQVVLATVIDADSLEREDAEERDEARALLTRCADRLPAGVPAAHTRIVAGLPARALLELAAVEHVDMIVVGRRGKGLSRAVLGSVAQQMSTTSPYPVLLAAPAATRR